MLFQLERSHNLKHIVYLFSDELCEIVGRNHPNYRNIAQKEYLKDSDVHDTLVMTDHPALGEDLWNRGFAVVGVEHSGIRFPQLPYVCYDVTELEEAYLEQIFCHMRLIPIPLFSTERLLIREICPMDVESLYELYRDRESVRFLDPLYEDPEEEREYIRNYIRNVYAIYGYGMWVMEEKQTGTVVGRIGLEQKELPAVMRRFCVANGFFSDKTLELGYMLGERYRHRGYAEEAARGVIRYAGERLEGPLLYAVTRAVNQPSCRLCERLGGRDIGMADENYRVYVISE